MPQSPNRDKVVVRARARETVRKPSACTPLNITMLRRLRRICSRWARSATLQAHIELGAEMCPPASV